MNKFIFGLAGLWLGMLAGQASAGPISPFPSGFVVVGSTTARVTSFGTPVEYAPGTATFVRLEDGENRWGDYSATTRDPSDPTKFWTIQEFALSKDFWATKIAEVSVKPGNKVNIVTSFTGSTMGDAFTSPPDTMGAVGPNHFVELLNGVMAIYDKNGGLVGSRQELTSFWKNTVGLTPTGLAFDPRILYDPGSGHWFATSLDNGKGGNTPANHVLVGVSNTNDPTGAWHGFTYTGDPVNKYFADFDTIGINRAGLFVSTNDFLGTNFQYSTLTAIDKNDLINGMMKTQTFNQVSKKDDGFPLQPVVNLDGSGFPEAILAEFDTPMGLLSKNELTGSIGTLSLSANGGNVMVTAYAQPASSPHIRDDGA